MVLTAKDVSKMSHKEFAKPSIEDMCTQSNCGKQIEEHPDERYRISGQVVCSDCYFEMFGNHVDEHPIYTPRLVA